MSNLIFIDTETTGLVPGFHEVVEVAWAALHGPIATLVLPHSLANAAKEALRINHYYERGLDRAERADTDAIRVLHNALQGSVLVAANPAFDAAHLAAYFGTSPFTDAPWHYRMLDIESWAAGRLGLDCETKVPSLLNVYHAVAALGHDIPEPDHTAKGDVATVRAIYKVLSYGR